MILLVLITGYYACKTSKMTELMQQGNQVNLRPFLMFRAGKVGYNQDGKLYFPITFKNVGHAPARNVRLHHKLFKNDQCIKNWFEPPTERFVVFPENDDVLLHSENLEKQVLQEHEIKAGAFLKVQFIVTYNGFSEIDNSTYYTVTNYLLTPKGYRKNNNGVEWNDFDRAQILTDEGLIKESEFENKLGECKDFVSNNNL